MTTKKPTFRSWCSQVVNVDFPVVTGTGKDVFVDWVNCQSIHRVIVHEEIQRSTAANMK